MGVGDYWNSIQPYVDPGNLLAGGPKHTDAGTVGGARPGDQSVLQDVPGTNYRYDPRTGQYYLKGVTDKYGLRPYIRFGAHVDRAHWDDDEMRWHLSYFGIGE